jgi:hypothetical protein
MGLGTLALPCHWWRCSAHDASDALLHQQKESADQGTTVFSNTRGGCHRHRPLLHPNACGGDFMCEQPTLGRCHRASRRRRRAPSDAMRCDPIRPRPPANRSPPACARPPAAAADGDICQAPPPAATQGGRGGSRRRRPAAYCCWRDARAPPPPPPRCRRRRRRGTALYVACSTTVPVRYRTYL